MVEVSVIIPVYNTEPWLEECLESACGQTLKSIEILCINDGSTDGSLAVLRKFAARDERIVVINQENRGVAHARNVGLNHAKGKYIYFLDSDDWIAPDALELLAGRMREKNLDILFFNARVIAEEGVEQNDLQRETNYFRRIHEYPSKCKGEELYTLFCNNKELIVSVCTQMTDRAFLAGHSLVFPEGIMHEDEVFVFKAILLASHAGYTDKVLFNRRVRPDSAMALKGSEKLLYSAFSCFACLKKMLQFCSGRDFPKACEEAVFSEVDRMMFLCRDRYGMLGEESRARVQEMAGRDRILFKALILTAFNSNKNIRELRAELKKQSEKARKTEAETRKKTAFLGHEMSRALTKLEQTQRKANQSNRELKNIKNGWSFRVGRIITYIPRRIRDLLYKSKPGRQAATKAKTVLLVEFNDYHGECLPGFYKYLTDLKCQVDLLVHEGVFKEKALDVIPGRTVYHGSVEEMASLLQYTLIERYQIVIFNSNAFTWKGRDGWHTLFKEFPFLNRYIDKIYVLEHQLEFLNSKLLEMGHVFFLTDKLPVDKRLVPVNCHWFGNTCLPPKNRVTRFISVGAIDPVRRNFKALMDAVAFLHNRGRTDFHITVIGLGELDSIAPELRQYFSVLGRLPYTDVWSEMRKSDFLLSLLDPDNPDHNRYITLGTSGSFQLIYGFSKPCLIAEKFAAVYGFSSENAVVYKENKELGAAMLKAMDMKEDEYGSIRKNLIALSDDIYQRSLENLKRTVIESGSSDKAVCGRKNKKTLVEKQ